MKYFAGITNEIDKRRKYRELAKTYHPDHGGSSLIMAEINKQYDEPLAIEPPSINVIFNRQDQGYEFAMNQARQSQGFSFQQEYNAAMNQQNFTAQMRQSQAAQQDQQSQAMNKAWEAAEKERIREHEEHVKVHMKLYEDLKKEEKEGADIFTRTFATSAEYFWDNLISFIVLIFLCFWIVQTLLK